jgi:predicted nucleic acid-binding protein
VVDASLIMGWCLPDERSQVSDRFVSSLSPDSVLMVPSLFWYEAANVLAMAMRRSRITAEQAEHLALLVMALPLECPLVSPQTTRTLVAMADRHQLSGYDAAYLELAIRLSCGLATLDHRLAAAAAQAGVPVFG